MLRRTIAFVGKSLGDIQTRALSTSTTLGQDAGILAQFFDDEANFGVSELRTKKRPGRPWSKDELRLKSAEDLHKLWYVLLKERNMLLTMREACVSNARYMPNPERIDKVQESMNNLEDVVHERNNAFLELETGQGADPPMRTVTSFMGFTYKKQAREHVLPAEVTGEKEYEQPYLDDDAYMMQKLWNEKEYWKNKERASHRALKHKLTDSDKRFRRSLRRTFNSLEQQ
uniref:Large ribosomal subunit protein uL29m n=1 Tax=Steinernema glaseri TaxID=37863 RepID=A0A1I7Y5S8_9BILA